jgi:hypothetical protein
MRLARAKQKASPLFGIAESTGLETATAKRKRKIKPDSHQEIAESKSRDGDKIYVRKLWDERAG